RAGDDLYLVLPDHLGQRETELRRAHGASQRDHHGAAAIQVRFVAVGRVDECGGIEVPIVVPEEAAYGASGYVLVAHAGTPCAHITFGPRAGAPHCRALRRCSRRPRSAPSTRTRPKA